VKRRARIPDRNRLAPDGRAAASRADSSLCLAADAMQADSRFGPDPRGNHGDGGVYMVRGRT